MMTSTQEARLAADVSEASRILRFLASMPSGASSATFRVVRQIMLQTDGRLLAQGALYDVKVKRLGGGVYRVALEAAPR